MWDTCTSYFGPKKIDRVGRGGQRRSKYGPEWASLLYIFGLGAFKRPLNVSRTPEIPPKWSLQLPLIDLSPFPTNLNSRQNSVCLGFKFSSERIRSWGVVTIFGETPNIYLYITQNVSPNMSLNLPNHQICHKVCDQIHHQIWCFTKILTKFGD